MTLRLVHSVDKHGRPVQTEHEDPREEWIRRAYRQPWIRPVMDEDDCVSDDTRWLCSACGHWFRLGEMHFVRGADSICVWCT